MGSGIKKEKKIKRMRTIDSLYSAEGAILYWLGKFDFDSVMLDPF